MAIKEHRRQRIEDQEFYGEVAESFAQYELLRVFAVKTVFKDLSFKQAVLEKCYFRNCTFIRCDFTGAQIKETNLKGSSFEACQFRYSTWEKTLLDEEFLDRCLPSEENLARDLVRSLRVNYTQIGNYEAVNKAASIEVALTRRHFYNAAYSKLAYYRSLPKYNGIRRLRYVYDHFRWKALHLIWGNGESIVRVLVTGAAVVLFAGLYLVSSTPNLTYLDALTLAFHGFWGVTQQPLPPALSTTLTMVRFVLFGLFMAILVKRLSRR